MKIKITADSSANLKALTGVDYSCVPLSIRTHEREFIDNDALDTRVLVEYLENHKGESRTACPSVGDWLDAFGDADIVYCVTIISTLSGSYNSAMIAKAHYEEEHPDRRVFVLDSYSAGPETKLLVEKIRELVIQGKDFETVCQEVTEYKQNHTYLIFCLESLKNLANNGRVPHAVAAITSLIGIRLIGNVNDEGQIHPIDKARGGKKAISAILKNMKKHGYNGGVAVIDHILNEEGAAALKNAILAEFPNAHVRIEECTGLCCFYAEKNGIMVGFER